jgi:hypothetical protein
LPFAFLRIATHFLFLEKFVCWHTPECVCIFQHLGCLVTRLPHHILQIHLCPWRWTNLCYLGPPPRGLMLCPEMEEGSGVGHSWHCWQHCWQKLILGVTFPPPSWMEWQQLHWVNNQFLGVASTSHLGRNGDSCT